MKELVIPSNIAEALSAHARAAVPIEACGLLAGVDSRVEVFHPMTNADNSTDHFAMVPEEQFAAVKKMRAAGQTMLAVYHSHPATPARPSQEDIRLAFTPGVVYVILSLLNPERPVIKGFEIDGETVTEVPVHVEES